MTYTESRLRPENWGDAETSVWLKDSLRAAGMPAPVSGIKERRVMKDDIYNRFRQELSKYHRKGYQMNYPNTQEFYDEDRQEHGYYIELAIYKKVKRVPRGV